MRARAGRGAGAACTLALLVVALSTACGRQEPAGGVTPAPEAGASPAAATPSPPQAQALPNPYAFDVDVALSDAAAKVLADGSETVIVSAAYFGDGKAGLDPAILNEVGQVDIGAAQVELPGAGRARLDGSAVRRERLAFIAGDLQVNVNVFSGRRSSDDNLLDCGFFQDSVAVAAAEPVVLSCRLIAE